LRAVFEHPTIAGLAELLDERRARLLAMVRELSAEEVEQMLAGAELMGTTAWPT
jgi:hypothetical protein